MPSAYVINNAAAALVAGNFYETSYFADPTQRLLLIDGRMDKQVQFVADNIEIFIDFGAAVSLTGFALLNHNLADIGGGSVTIQGATDAAITTSVVTAKATTTINPNAPRHRDAVLQFAAVSKRYWRVFIELNTPANALKLGELLPYVASTQLTRGYTDGSSEPEEIISVGVQAMYGERRDAFMAGPMRHKRMRFQDYTTAQAEELKTMWRATRGPVSPLLWIESYEAVSTAAAAAQQDCIYGNLELQTFEAAYTDYDLVQPPELIIKQKGRGVGQ